MLFSNVLKESIFPSFISLCGLMFSAAVLSKLELSDVQVGIPFKILKQLTVLVPVMSNLNGNFELNLSCRLGTCANNGKLINASSRMQIYKGNLIFMIFQSIVLGIFCASFAVVVSGMVGILSSLRELIILTVSSILTVVSGSIVLGTFMNSLIIQCVSAGLDPDNIAAPIACAFGDATTLIFFILITNLFLLDSNGVVSFVVLLLLIALAFFANFQLDNVGYEWLHSKSIWAYLPYIASICITTFCGLALEQELENFNGLASIAPVIDGLSGGNISIYASRLTTSYSINRTEDDFQVILAVWLLTLFDILALLLLSSVLHITAITTSLFLGSLITFHICLYLLYKFVKPFCEYLNDKNIDLDAVVLPIMTALGDLGIIVYIAVFLMLNVLERMFFTKIE
eukprot:NODE_119_length_18895_cov_0.454990.p6 type:complete len:400 gc:universal NODE_119_length_18895_cov_0.454990:6981-5782(-)